MTPGPGVTVEVRGPFFGPGAAPAIRSAAERTVRELVELGDDLLAERLRPRPAGVYLSVAEAGKGRASTGYYRRSINAVTRGLAGRIDDGGVVYGPWLEGVSHRNQMTRFKGYRSFRVVGQRLRKEAEGVLRRHVAQAVRELGG